MICGFIPRVFIDLYFLIFNIFVIQLYNYILLSYIFINNLLNNLLSNIACSLPMSM